MQQPKQHLFKKITLVLASALIFVFFFHLPLPICMAVLTAASVAVKVYSLELAQQREEDRAEHPQSSFYSHCYYYAVLDTSWKVLNFGFVLILLTQWSLGIKSSTHSLVFLQQLEATLLNFPLTFLFPSHWVEVNLKWVLDSVIRTKIRKLKKIKRGKYF